MSQKFCSDLDCRHSEYFNTRRVEVAVGQVDFQIPCPDGQAENFEKKIIICLQ